MSNIRYENNKKILEILSKEIEEYQDFRFIQLLWKLGIVNNKDRFYEESSETLEKIKQFFMGVGKFILRNTGQTLDNYTDYNDTDTATPATAIQFNGKMSLCLREVLSSILCIAAIVSSYNGYYLGLICQ